MAKADLVPTADTWVSRDLNGKLKSVPVKQMTDQHLWRWIHFYRQRYRTAGFQGTDAELDAVLMASYVSAPAIYAEAAKRALPVGTVTNWQPKTNKELLGQFLAEVSRTNRPAYQALFMASIVYRPKVSVLVVTVRKTGTVSTLLDSCVPYFELMASQIWKKPVSVHIIRPPMAILVSRPVVETDTMSAEPGVRRITLDED